MSAGTTSRWSTAALAAAVLLGAPAALAQDSGSQGSGSQGSNSVNDYRLPDPTQSRAPRIPGPVDPENPYRVPSNSQTASAPDPEPAPRITPPPPPATTNPPAKPSARPSPRPAATPTARETPAEVASPDATPAAVPTVTAAPTPLASPSDLAPVPDATEPAVIPASAPAEPSGIESWMIALALGLGALAAGVWWFRRRAGIALAQVADAPPFADEPELPPAPEAEPIETAEPLALTVPPAAPADHEVPSLAEPLALATTFVPRAVRLSLVYVTVQYELEVANAGDATLPPLAVRGDLASAHASIGTREQLAPEPQQLDVRHAIPALAPGEMAMLKGEVRLPLPQVVPVVKGTARFFVPLVRFCILAPDGNAVRRVFTLGPRGENGALASVRLDAGPRNLRELEAREIEAARGFVLDLAGAAS